MSSIIRTSPNPEPSAATDCSEKDSCDNNDEKGSPAHTAHSPHDDANSDDKDMSAASVNDKPDKNTEIDKDNEQKVVDDDHATECVPPVSPNPEQCKDNDDEIDEKKSDQVISSPAHDDDEPPQHQVRIDAKDEDGADQQQPENLHLSPAEGKGQGESVVEEQGESPHNQHDSPAHPLNLHQSPTHDTPPHPFHRPTPTQSYHPHPSLDTAGHFSSPYSSYNHHYFSNANSPAGYNGQLHGFAAHNNSFTAEQHEMYMAAAGRAALESHHSSHGLPGLGALQQHFSRTAAAAAGQPDPYNFPNSDDEMVSPGRGSNPLQMGFSGMPMPLIAPKAQKPRKPRKPKSPKPDAVGLLSMQMKEDSRG